MTNKIEYHMVGLGVVDLFSGIIVVHDVNTNVNQQLHIESL